MAQNRNKAPDGKNMKFTEQDVLNNATTRYRHRRLGKSGIAVILCVVLAAVLVVLAGIYFKKHPIKLDWAWNLGDIRDEIAESLIEDDAPETEPVIEFETVTKTRDDVAVGDLILVNYQYKYVFPENEDHLVNIYKNKTADYSVAYNDYLLDGDVLSVFSELMADLKEATGDSSILINSTYRSLEDQQSIYDSYVQSNGEEYAKQYVADPGSSEHHTGIALDLTVRFADGTYELMQNYEHLDTLRSLCIKHGFVQRYPENKYVFTHINTEPWHYRYVGVPHSYLMYKDNMCLEEYIEFIREYTTDKMLLLSSDGEVTTCNERSLPEEGYVVYYVPMGDGSTVDISVPADADEYTISGDNCGGFIVTAVFGSPELPVVNYSSPVVGVTG